MEAFDIEEAKRSRESNFQYRHRNEISYFILCSRRPTAFSMKRAAQLARPKKDRRARRRVIMIGVRPVFA